MANESGKEYVIGKGQVLFDKFLPGTKTGTGERYLGNTPELSTSSDEETLDHYDADSGLNVKDESVTIEQNVTGSLVTDNINMENVAMFFGGEVESATIVAGVGLTETHKVRRKGVWVQLGSTVAFPQGARKVVNVVVKKGAATIDQADNYDVDLDLARVFIETDAPGIALDDDLIYTYDQEATTRRTTVGKGTEVRGALRFVSFNPIGPKKDYFWPYVKLSANGDFSLKGDEWQQIPFTFEVLKKDAATERVYIDERTATA